MMYDMYPNDWAGAIHDDDWAGVEPESDPRESAPRRLCRHSNPVGECCHHADSAASGAGETGLRARVEDWARTWLPRWDDAPGAPKYAALRAALDTPADKEGATDGE